MKPRSAAHLLIERLLWSGCHVRNGHQVERQRMILVVAFIVITVIGQKRKTVKIIPFKYCDYAIN